MNDGCIEIVTEAESPASTALMEQISQHLTKATGLSVRLQTTDLFAARRRKLDDDWLPLSAIAKQVRDDLSRAGDVVAVVVLDFGENLDWRYTDRPWYLLGGEIDGEQQRQLPVIALSIPGLDSRFAAPIQDPVSMSRLIASHVVGGLAVAARGSYDCDAWGCPTTLWQSTGVNHRCGASLCDQCYLHLVDVVQIQVPD